MVQAILFRGNGAGRGLDLSNGSGEDPSRTPSSNVTVKNLRIVDFNHGIDNANANNNTFIGNYVANCEDGFWIGGSANNTIFYNTIKDNVNGISINYAGGNNVITENNMINSEVKSNNVIIVWLSPEPTVDRNYWSDYLTKYPNAKEIDSSGIWDTPYNFGGRADNHPLMKPVTISDSSLPTPTPSPTSTSTPTPSPSIPEFPSWMILALLVVASASFIVFKRSVNRQ